MRVRVCASEGVCEWVMVCGSEIESDGTCE